MVGSASVAPLEPPAPVAAPAPIVPVRRSALFVAPVLHKASTIARRMTSRFTFDKDKPLQIECSPRVFRCVWLLINLFQVVLTLTLLRVLYSNVWSLLAHDQIANALQQFGLQYNGHVMLGWVVATVGTITMLVLDIAHSVRYSIRRRQLVLRDAGEDTTLTARGHWWHWNSIQWPAWLQPKVELVRRVAYECDIHGRYFNVGLYVRELFEIGLQTYQTYRVSYTVSEPWINTLAVAVVVINCWTTPLLDLYLFDDEPRRRVMCIVVDVVLDTLGGLALPFFVFASWRSKVPLMDWYDPLWIMDAVNDLMFFHINTWLDLLSRLMPAVSMIHCIHAIRAMLKPRRPEAHPSTATAGILAVIPQPPKPVTKTTLRKPCPRVAAIHVLLFIYGAVVLTMGVLAQKGPHLTPVLAGCQKSTRPWLLLNAKYPCAVLELNCVDDPQLTESDTAMDDRLAQADSFTLAALVITHCPRVQMPSRLASFRKLLWLEIYNSTLVAWPEAAALTHASHPLLSRVLFVRGSVDPALLTPDTLLQRLVLSPSLPRTLKDVAIVASDLSAISPTPPSSSSSSTTPRLLLSLVLQQCELSVVPPLSSVRVVSLSLALNPIMDVELNAVHATGISLQATRVRSCSSPSNVLLHAADSPLCTQHPTDQAVSCSPPAVIDCTTTQRPLFPLASLDARRRAVSA